MDSGLTPSEPSTWPSLPAEPFPQPFGRYCILERLGSGGMGAVYRARDEILQIDVALKVPHPQLLALPSCRERFYHEARAAARLDHPNFVRIYDVGTHQGILYLTMCYIQGRRLECHPLRPVGEAVSLVRTLALALAYAHSRGVIHRDLKPANILLTHAGAPVITDFGLALRLDSTDPRLTSPGVLLGTLPYMAPEQVCPELAPLGPACDVYGLGAVLYELLTGRLPFRGTNAPDLLDKVLHSRPLAPSQLRPECDAALDFLCLRALACRDTDRFADMEEFSTALAAYLAGVPTVGIDAGTMRPTSAHVPGSTDEPPRARRDCLRFAFIGHGEHVPADAVVRDRLFLDVGHDLRPGVIDHHQETGLAASTATLVLRRPDLVRATLSPRRRPDEPFTLVLHEEPDLDGVIAAWLAAAYLETGAYPTGAEALARYADKIDEGSLGMSLANPFSLYAAYQHLSGRLLRRAWSSPHQRWQEAVRLGMQVVGFVAEVMEHAEQPLPAVDAFACPGLFGPEDRQEVQADVERYEAKLSDPATRARQARLRLPGQFGGKIEVEALCVRDVQNSYDPRRCLFFKDWARTDARRSPDGKGFVALLVFQSEGPGQVRRCLLSVRPDSGATLQGLAALLDEAEGERRRQVFGVDDRVTDPATGRTYSPRPGYTNADPWYDGRAHGYTIVDAPRRGTLLTADEIEALFLHFGGVDGGR